VTKLKLYLEILIAIDGARRNDLTVATVIQKGLSVAVDVVYLISVRARAPIIDFNSICCKRSGKALHLFEYLVLFQLFQNIYSQYFVSLFSARFPGLGWRDWYNMSRLLRLNFALFPCLPFGVCLIFAVDDECACFPCATISVSRNRKAFKSLKPDRDN
jgi:hypothetical protein